ncbi:MAG: hypothetical protein ACLQLG_11065 [Thermoguttaceae bacterium]
MSVTHSKKDEAAKWYAERHLYTDPGTRVVYYLPTGAPEREIRLLEVNELIVQRESDPLEPLDFGIDVGGAEPHSLLVVDVTPAQWDRIRSGQLALPAGWSLEGAVPFTQGAI